jgi:3D (Asp-Asp-Asp) domain-containing protein
VLKSKLLVAVSLWAVPGALSADLKHKQPMARHQKGRFVAFAYTTSQSLTAEGRLPVAGKTIAADPRVLPMGTRVRISGAGPWSGEYRVGDKGGKIKGRTVDVFVPSVAEAMEFGRRSVEVTILELPKRPPSEGTRARRVSGSETGSVNFAGCVTCHVKAIMAKDEATGSSAEGARSSVEARRTRIGPGQSDSRESRNPEALARLSAFQRPSAY